MIVVFLRGGGRDKIILDCPDTPVSKGIEYGNFDMTFMEQSEIKRIEDF